MLQLDLRNKVRKEVGGDDNVEPQVLTLEEKILQPSKVAGVHGEKNPVSAAIILMFIGVALAVFFWALGGGGNLFHGEHVPNWLPVIGIFPFAIGLGKLIGLIFERRPPK